MTPRLPPLPFSLLLCSSGANIFDIAKDREQQNGNEDGDSEVGEANSSAETNHNVREVKIAPQNHAR